ncbi:hypothetical protein [Pedobacter sp. MR22-3]|uniref:hypothetical protein n=1 Tax=Pedobacter sp. MR22-3 TaxID=2994552 RepID=UPI0022456B10|nr:hypothetical protein [Pedobacter sp. MR22-3]MCX2583062.1 hypothetical protein [Pedobacter sp. MR22-3]
MKKIKSCYYEVNGKKFLVNYNSAILMQIGKDHKFFVEFATNENFEQDFIPKKEAAISQVKWAYILSYSFSKLEKNKAKQDVWGYFIKENGTVPIKKYGIDKNYILGNEITFSPTSQENPFWEGAGYVMILFIDEPGDGISFPFMAVKNLPEIRGYYFDKQKNIENNPEIGINDGFYNYNTTIKLYFSTHMLPIKSLPKGSNVIQDGINVDVATEWENLQLTIELLDEAGDTQTTASTKEREYRCDNGYKFILDKPLIEGELNKFIEDQSSLSANCSFIVPITIELDWKDKFHKNHKAQPTKKYYVMIAIKNKKTGVIYICNPKDEQWFQTVDNKIEQIPTSHFFAVKYNSFDVILRELEAKKNNQIQYIGDVQYTRKEYDPCGYSMIEISDEGDEDRKPFVVFDENKLADSGDKTSQTFDIIRGDAKKDVLISLKELHNKNVMCMGVMLPKNEKHDSKENVFLMDTILAAKKLGNDYERVEDTKHKKQLRKSNIAVTAENENDTDVIVDEKQPAYDVEKVQNLVAGTDYEYAGEDKLKLKLKYLYNKSYDNAILKAIGYEIDEQYSAANLKVKEIAWVARYIFWKDYFVQQYFVPVSTCRYPNQLVRTRVFPNLEWWINVKYETEEPVYVRQTPNYKHREFFTEKGQNKKLKESRLKEKEKNWKIKKYELDFEAGFKIDGEENPLIPGDGFPLLNAINFLLKAYETFKEITFADEAKEGEAAIASGTARTTDGSPSSKKMVARWKLRKGRGLPFRIEVSTPAFSGGIQGKFAQSKSKPNEMGAFYFLEFAAKPLFGIKGELDLLFYAQFIGPIGQAMYRLSQIVKKVNYLTLGAIRIDYYINVGAKVDFNLEIKALEYHSVDGWDGGEIQFYIPIEVYLNAGVDVNASIEGIGSISADARIEGKAEFEVRATHDERNNKCPALLKFNGLTGKVWLKFSAKDDAKSEEGEPEEEPDHKFSIIDPKDPWNIDII